MSNKLLIIESPSKREKFSDILKEIDPNSKWDVEATIGPIHQFKIPPQDKPFDPRDLNEEDFNPQFKLREKGIEVVNALNKKITEGDYERIVIATDPDRGGEITAEYLRISLGLNDSDFDRCDIYQITKPHVEEALANPRGIDKDCIINKPKKHLEV